ALVGLLYSPTVGSIGLVATYVAFIASGEAVARLKRVVMCPAVYWGAAFLGVVIAGVTYASASWQERWTDVFKWRTILWFIVLFALFDSESWKKRLLFIFLIGTGIGLVASFLGVYSGVALWKAPAALLRNNVTQSMAFAVSSLICLGAALSGECLGRWRAATLLGACLFAGNVFFVSHGRSGYVLFVVGVVVLVMWYTRPKQWIASFLALALLLGGVVVLSPGMQKRLIKGIDEWQHADELSQETSMGSRKVFYSHTMEIVARHPVGGVGTGGFKKAYAEQIAGRYDPDDWRSVVTGDPHNQYLAILVQHGLPGLGVFLIWLVAVGRTREGMPIYRGLALAILCGWCATSLFSSHFRTFAEGHLVTTFLGALLAPGRPNNGDGFAMFDCPERQATK
ncbi:MAG: O-antigen ligase family protein, partial [Nitrospira sp.]|nr:O-antigen ligase family protein [Nitrospira sp.]